MISLYILFIYLFIYLFVSKNKKQEKYGIEMVNLKIKLELLCMLIKLTKVKSRRKD